MNTGTQVGPSDVGEEEMEDHVEMEEDSTSNVQKLETHGTFIVDTTDGTVTETRYFTKRWRPSEKVSEDLLNQHITWVSMNEDLSLLRKIRSLKIVQETVSVLSK